MAQTQSATNEGLGELGLLVSGGAATGPKSIVLIKTSCTANAAQTYAGITKATESGFAIGDGTVTVQTTSQTNDTVRVVKTHTAGATLTVLGAGMCNNDDDQLYMLVCYNAGLAMESGDTLQNTLSIQFSVV